MFATDLATRCNVASELFIDTYTKHVESTGSDNDNHAVAIAAAALNACVPEMQDAIQVQRRIQLDASLAVCTDNTSSASFSSIYVDAALKGIDIQELHEEVTDSIGSFVVSRFDLCARFTPVYVHLDPVDMMLTDAVYVPLGNISSFIIK